MPIEQLAAIKKQQEDECFELQKQLEALSSARARYLSSRSSVDDIGNYADGNVMLVPLTQSLYVPGRIVESDKVIIELGTGYYCEKNVADAKELIDRKANFLFWNVSYQKVILISFLKIGKISWNIHGDSRIGNYKKHELFFPILTLPMFHRFLWGKRRP